MYGNNCIYNILLNIFNIKFTVSVLFVHNLNFDGFLIIEALSGKNIKFKVFSKGLDIYSITVFYNDKTLILKCSYKILPLSLLKISTIFNINEKLPFPYKFVNKNNLNYKGEIPEPVFFNSLDEYLNFSKLYTVFDLKKISINYCQNDTIITSKFLVNIKKLLTSFNVDINSIYSAPSLALKIFEKKFNKNKITTNSNALIDKFARNAYFGGRCEVYANPFPEEYIFHFDFSSMYGRCMLEKFPYGKHSLNLNAKEIDKPGIYWIEFESKNINRPVLPHHRLKDGKLMFCNGKFTGAFWYEEILLFIKYGGKVNKILYALTFENYDYVFREYVEFFTNLRTKSEAYNVFGKLMINSMYGRLGMREIENYSFITYKNELNNLKEKININSIRELNNIALIDCIFDKKLENFLNIKKQKTKNNIVIAAAITAKARIKLYEAQEAVIKNGGRLLYSDTDSIFAAYKKNVINEQHGEVFWDSTKKNTIIKDAIFFSAKSYALKFEDNTYDIKIKGYNQKELNFDAIKEFFLQKNKIELKNYKFLNKKNLELFYSETIKHFDLNFYDKRIFINKNSSTIPYIFDNFKYK